MSVTLRTVASKAVLADVAGCVQTTPPFVKMFASPAN